MAHFDFDRVIERRNSGCMKWDTKSAQGLLPLWVADMDFEAAPAIVEALQRRIGHGVYGYTEIPAAYYEAIVNWQLKRNSLKIKAGDIIPVPGVVAALTAVIQALSLPGDQLIMQTPAYNCFYSCTRNSGLELLRNPLRYTDGRFEADFEQLSHLASQERARLLLLCNPHNPSGRLWSREELLKFGTIARDHQLIVISDEIHSDVRPNDSHFISFGSIARELGLRCVILNSPSKPFNLAGLRNAYIIADDRELYERINRQVNINEICDLNPFGVIGLIEAYEHSADWLYAVNDYIQGNYAFMKGYIAEQIPTLRTVPLEATYLSFIDCRGTGLADLQLNHTIRREGRVMLSPGIMYGEEGSGFMRLNLACSRTVLTQALEGIKKALV
ncbi:MAG: pyridoxal phosphate-dependent aminotransferase [Succinivibrio sp.]|nr:pyridoxal phosphate-dependent aminotransferase [Succinivibrio sp.]